MESIYRVVIGDVIRTVRGVRHIDYSDNNSIVVMLDGASEVLGMYNLGPGDYIEQLQPEDTPTEA